MGPVTVSRTSARRLRSLVLLLVLAAIVCAVAIAVAAETLRIESVWSAEAPTVDGKLTEWSAPLVTLGSTPLSLGVRNDGQFVYVALASSDQTTRMMLGAAGFTVWMDPSGKNKKSFGITVPPTIAGGRGMRGRGPGGGPPPDQSGAPAQPGQEGQKDPPQGGPGGPGGPAIGAITSIEVLGASKDDKRRFELAYARTIGLDVAARVAEGVLVYELRVPLSVTEAQPYGVKSSPGATIGLGIETAELAQARQAVARTAARAVAGWVAGPPGGGGGGGGGHGWRHGRRRDDGRRWRSARRDGRRAARRRPRRHARDEAHQGVDGRSAREAACVAAQTTKKAGPLPVYWRIATRSQEVDRCARAASLSPFSSCSRQSRPPRPLNLRQPAGPTPARFPPSKRRPPA